MHLGGEWIFFVMNWKEELQKHTVMCPIKPHLIIGPDT